MAPTFFAFLISAGGLLASSRRALTLLMVCCLFGGAAAISLPAFGGANVTPAMFYLPFLVAYVLADGGASACVRQLAFPNAGFWLLLLIVWSVLATYFLPRMLAGEVLIATANRDVADSGISLIALRPVSGNVTQSGYALGALCVFMAVRALLAKRDRFTQFVDAVLLLAALNSAAAIINLAEIHLGLPGVLEYVRNGNYAIINGGEVGGVPRISGTFPEASSFAGFTLPLFAFTSSLWLSNVRPVYSGALAAASLVLLLISTSTTAYVGLGAYVACAGSAVAWRGIARGSLPRAGSLIAGVVFGLFALFGLLIFDPSIVKTLTEFFDTTVFNKLQSASGVERSAWNTQAWSNFVDTYGVGVGLGSARASSYPLVLLSNVGVIGTLLFLAFCVQVCFSSLRLERDRHEVAVALAARQAVIVSLLSSCISATVFDLGVAFYAFAAAATPLWSDGRDSQARVCRG